MGVKCGRDNESCNKDHIKKLSFLLQNHQKNDLDALLKELSALEEQLSSSTIDPSVFQTQNKFQSTISPPQTVKSYVPPMVIQTQHSFVGRRSPQVCMLICVVFQNNFNLRMKPILPSATLYQPVRAHDLHRQRWVIMERRSAMVYQSINQSINQSGCHPASHDSNFSSSAGGSSHGSLTTPSPTQQSQLGVVQEEVGSGVWIWGSGSDIFTSPTCEKFIQKQWSDNIWTEIARGTLRNTIMFEITKFDRAGKQKPFSSEYSTFR